jgi:hypothetical protein
VSYVECTLAVSTCVAGSNPHSHLVFFFKYHVVANTSSEERNADRNNSDSLLKSKHQVHATPFPHHTGHMHPTHMQHYSNPAYSQSIPTERPMSNPFHGLLDQIRRGPPRRPQPESPPLGFNPRQVTSLMSKFARPEARHGARARASDETRIPALTAAIFRTLTSYCVGMSFLRSRSCRVRRELILQA